MIVKNRLPGARRSASLLILSLVTLLAGACRPDAALETRSFVLTYMNPGEAVELLEPYVYPDRDGAPGAMGVGEHALTVRELPANLDRIELVLAEFDRPPPSVRLQFTLIHADGQSERDPAIAEVEEELRGLFRFEGYRVIGTAVMRGTERTYHQQNLVTSDGALFQLEVQLGNVRGEPGDRNTQLGVELGSEFEGVVLSAQLGVKEAQMVVLGTTSVRQLAEGALILMVEAVIEEGG